MKLSSYAFPEVACAPKVFDQDSAVCVCNSTYCDTVPPLPTLTASDLVVYTSSKAGKRFEQRTLRFSTQEETISEGMRVERWE